MNLAELAERCEKAVGADRRVDVAIFATVCPEAFGNAQDAALYARTNWTLNRGDWIYLREIGLPAYTTSLDAALTLVPEGWHGAEITLTASGRGLARTWDRLGTPLVAKATTPALALCAAALRARSIALAEGEG